MHELIMWGPPMTRREPEIDSRGRHARLRPHATTEEGIRQWRMLWMANGRPFISGPIELELLIGVPRPKQHYRADGSLSAAGLRQPVPTSSPDCSNVLKLVEDALKGYAFGDDRLIARLRVEREWTPRARTILRWRAHDQAQTSSESGPTLFESAPQALVA